MARYSYKGKLAGKTVNGEIEAANEAAAAAALKRKNVVPLQISRMQTRTQTLTQTMGAQKAVKKTTKNTANKPTSLAQKQLFIPNVSLEDLVIFSRQMYSLVKAGIPIIRAMQGLADTTTSIRLKEALQQVSIELEKGKPLANAMSAHPKIFSRLFVSMINVGENTGKLEEAFLQLAQYLEDEQETRKRIQSATRYPIFVLIAIGLALLLMNLFVIPTFAEMFAKFNADLPWTTVLLVSSSNFFVNYWYVVIAAIIVMVFAARAYVKTEKGKLNWSRYKLNIPVVGSIIERSTLARFARSFAMMLQAGVPLTQALNLVSEALENDFMSKKVQDIRRGIERGDSLLRTANASNLFTPLVMQMIAVGEETGRIDAMLEEVADFYEREVDFDLKSLTAKIEPILISIVAGMVMILALGIFMPMWDMMGAIKGQ
ncbi:type II secretion system F family protein [Catenovulum sediminis]|uniref:Type II secretion system F family protein n=1 Tax=Catenovulum sediminis TaxID=1740262 RepID=A0ABV1RCI6_9ALTE|nr:type II secretion system F family protein [Catenovulum sediminis]